VALVGAISLAVLAWPATAFAQTEAEGDVIRATGVPLSEVVLGAPSDNPRTLRLPVGRAQLLRLPVEVRDVIVSQATVADVVVKSPKLVYMLGRQAGSTSVVMLDENANIIYSLNIVVAQELSDLKSMYQALLPDEDISVTSMQGNIILTGNVRSPTVASQARDLAARFVDDDSQIINRLQILSDLQVMLRVRIAEGSPLGHQEPGHQRHDR